MKRKEKIYICFLLLFGLMLCISIIGIFLTGKTDKDYNIEQYSGTGKEIHATDVVGQKEQYESESHNSESSVELFPCTVTKNVDGDTIYVEGNIFEDETKIRFIGVNTPESVSPDEDKNCDEGQIASDYTKNILSPGTTVYLEFDENMMDQYGRTLAYIWLSDKVDTSSYSDFCTYNYGAILMQNTYCEAVYYAPNGKYKEWYEQLENEAQTDR